MAQQVRLSYTPYGGSPATLDLDVLSIRGAAEPDEVEIFPDLKHEYLDGSLAEQIAGGRRNIELVLRVVDVALSRRKLVQFWLDPVRSLTCLATAPANPSALAGSATGSLTNGVAYYYKITAVDAVGESAGSTEVSDTATAPDLTINLTWDAVTNARLYKIYRKVAVGGTYALLAYSTTNSYSDDGTVTPFLASTSAPASATSISVVREGNAMLSEWLNGFSRSPRYSFRFNESSIFNNFPI